MVARKIAVALMCVAACLMVTAAQAAKTAKTKGTIVSVDATKLVVTDKDNAQKTLDVSANVSVTIKGEPGKITDLKAGDKIGYTVGDDGKVVTISSGHKPKSK